MYFSELGYDDYDGYVTDSDGDWKKIKGYFYALNDTYQCRLCHRRKELLVHKRTYHFLRFAQFQKLPKKYVFKILVYLCHPCNKRVHFYPDKSKVPLDYLFLWEQEQKVYWSVRFIFKRVYTDITQWVIKTKRKKRQAKNMSLGFSLQKTR